MARQLSVFISYSHADKDVARGIAAGLSARGVRVWIDEGELRLGDSLIERIAQALQDVHFVIALVSPVSVSSPWCQKELAIAVGGGLKQKGVKVLPLRLGDAEMPPMLADAFYLDIDAGDLSSSVERLFQDATAHFREYETAVGATLNDPFEQLRSARRSYAYAANKVAPVENGPRVYQVRPAMPDDMTCILGLIDSAARWLRDNKNTDQWAQPWPDESTRNARVLAGIALGKTWMVESDDSPIGTITYSEQGNDALWTPSELSESAVYVSRLIVSRTYAGHGIGAALIDWAAQRGRRQWNATWIRADAWTTNFGLHSYLKNLGFSHLRTYEFESYWTYPAAALFQKPMENVIRGSPIHLEEYSSPRLVMNA